VILGAVRREKLDLKCKMEKWWECTDTGDRVVKAEQNFSLRPMWH